MSRRTVGSIRGGLLGAGLAVVAACSAPAPRPAPPAPVAPPPRPAPADPVLPQALPPPVAEAAEPSPWQRLRSRFALQGCDYRPAVQRYANLYTKNPRPFTAAWKQAMPFLLLVLDELERRDLPGEFAMLPFVESGYSPVPPRGDRPAGMWQLMPDTARGAGLAVSKDYDGRLDAIASTRTALDLLERYEREFGDWRLVNMAFNSGEFRVKKLLGNRDPKALSAEELGRLAFNPVTHEHLDRLLALSCIVEDPRRFGVTLPQPQADDRLRSVDLQAGMDLRLAARLAAVDTDDLRRWNAGHRRNRMAYGSNPRLLLPSPAVDRFQAAATGLPVAYWSDWREQPAPHGGGLGLWAAQIGVPVAVLALANSIDENATVGRNTRLLVPGLEAEPVAGAARPAPAPGAHVVVAGDTLTGIARRYKIALKDLRRWNPRAGGTLHLGDRLRLGPTTD